ncbi:MAG: acyl-CoA dehydrogenase [SAR324 cluster bacterium]|nr:acyl-CoA dehydrogenase [SAR324 cluster bacterium]
MSSTEYKVDRRDILFTINEVFQASKLCELPEYSEMDQDLFNMTINESANFAEKVIAPINATGDKQGCVVQNKTVKTPDGFAAAWKKMGEDGWIGMNMPVEVGGQGMPNLITAASRDILMGANPAFFLTCTLTSGSANLIRSFGNAELIEQYCEKMFSGEWTGSMCLTEPSSGSFLGDITTTAIKEGDHYQIKGTKQFITSGEHDMADNIIHLLLARTPNAPLGTKGISLFVVPKIRLDGTPNDVHIVNIEHKMGIMGSPTCVLSFGDNGNCHGYLLQEENKGMAQMFQMMNEARLFVAIQGLSASAAALGFAQSYANERLQGAAIEEGKNPNAPKIPIVQHPDVRRMLMRMKATTEGLRGLVYACGYYDDMAEHAPEELKEHYQNLLDIHIPIAKSFATDQGFESACTGIQVLGGVGFTKDFPLEQNARDLKIASIYEGTNGIQALDLVGRKFQIKNGALVASLKQELETLGQIKNIPANIQKLIAEWKKYESLMFDAIMNLQKMSQTHGPRGYFLYAVNMQSLMGDVMCAYYLLKQAIVAQNKFDAMVKGDPKQFAAENLDGQFYWNKVRTTEFYIYSILPRALENARVIENGHISPLEAYL